MKSTGVLLVGYSNIDAKIAAEIARVAFPQATVKNFATVTEAIDSEPFADTELLVLPRPTQGAIDKALEADDTAGLPRWAIVIVGDDPVPPGVEMLTPEEWAGPATSHAFRSAMAQHSLRRDLARSRGDLLTVGVRVTHDIRTQVAAILATAELSKELLEAVEPEQGELYQPIFDAVDALGKIMERLSFVARISANGAPKSKVLMKEPVKSALAKLTEEVRKARASVKQPIDWPEVTGNKSALEWIWFKLVANALVHAGPTPQIELGWKKDKSETRFWVRDHGNGVSAAKLEGIFQPFHQLHRSSGPRGMGLPIVQRLIELQGGRCGYEPLKKGGSEFFFILPA